MQIRIIASLSFVMLLLSSLLTLATANANEGLQLEALLSEDLQSVIGFEFIVSRVTIPPNTSLPKHWHPGEEIPYVLEGSVVLWQEGKEDVATIAGDAIMIPPEQIHTAISGDEGAVILVFRVHPKGEPERVLVD
jgi:quercetin dioxygenase-like cupin family protein